MSGTPLLETPLAAWHHAHGGRMVEFGGWSMPVQYTTIVQEHQAVRRSAGLFDISHMGRLTVRGPTALEWLERVTTNHVGRLKEYQIQYSLMVNEEGGVVDDVLVYRLPDCYFVVCNASNRGAVIAQLQRQQPVGAGSVLDDATRLTAMIAIQGPAARETFQPLFSEPLDSLGYYHAVYGRVLRSAVPDNVLVSRTGYTGEDGFEVISSSAGAVQVWEALLESGRSRGVVPCGLGARDTLRFEAAMPLYGHELSSEIDPYAAGVGWAVKLDKGEFVGRAALQKLKQNPGSARVGLRLEGKRIARQGSAVLHEDRTVGAVTSGTFAPTLDQSLAMALVALDASRIGTLLTVDVRGHRVPAEVVKLPFYRRAQAAVMSPARS
jgi:aminomethyltransferase